MLTTEHQNPLSYLSLEVNWTSYRGSGSVAWLKLLRPDLEPTLWSESRFGNEATHRLHARAIC